MNRKNFAKAHGRAVLPGQMWTANHGVSSIRVMAVAEGYAMVRNRGAGPFILAVKEIDAKYEMLNIPSPSTSTPEQS